MIRTILIVTLSLVISRVATATPFTFDDVVDGHSNLFFTDWGHWYTQDIDAALNAAGSTPARAASFAGNGFNFSAFDTLEISASGLIQAHGSVYTGPDGCRKEDCALHDGNFRLLPMYSLIGIWSSSATEIVPFGTWHDVNSGLGLFNIGSSARLIVPDFPAAYLFLGANDGAFADNTGLFNVRFIADIAEPGMLGLLGAGILGISMLRRRRARRAV